MIWIYHVLDKMFRIIHIETDIEMTQRFKQWQKNRNKLD
jgi:hypothetical protein